MRLAIGCLIFLLSYSVYTQSNYKKKDTLKVLFVGNSFSFYYNLPQVVKAMSEYSEIVYIDTRHSLVSGSKLSDHLNQKKNTKTIEMLNNQRFDYVVVNHHSLAAIEETENFFKTSKKFIDLVKSKNAIPVFMMTWAYKSNPLMQKTISETFIEMSKRYQVDIVPCGQLFAQARKWQPNLNLFEDDDKHPSKHATYLNGLAFFKYFTNEKTSAIPKRISTFDINGEKLYLLFLTEKNSDYLKELVNDFNFKTRLN